MIRKFTTTVLTLKEGDIIAFNSAPSTKMTVASKTPVKDINDQNKMRILMNFEEVNRETIVANAHMQVYIFIESEAR